MSSVPHITEAATYTPSLEEQGQLLDFVGAMHARGRGVSAQPVVINAAGESYELTADMAALVVGLLETLAAGQAVTLVPRHRLLTTQEAADLLNVSRPTLIKTLERGDLGYEMRGRHRRIRLDDLLAYQAALRQHREVTLSEMQRESQEDGLYDVLDGRPLIRR